MDKMVLIAPSGSSGSTHHMRVGDRRKAKINIPNFFFTIKYPRTLATSITTDSPDRVSERMASVGGDQNLFVCRPGSETHAHSRFFSTDLGEIEDHLAATQVEPGISYFNARRELWLNGKKEKPRLDNTVDSITRLDEMVRDPQALRSDRVWEAGLGRISKRLIEGGRLKYNLPMHLLVCNITRICIQYPVVLTRSGFSR